MNPTNAQHTPTPWRNDGLAVSDASTQSRITGPDGTQVATAYGWGDKGLSHANAAYIVRAVNAHDELLAALKHFMAYSDDVMLGRKYSAANLQLGLEMCRSNARAAIAKAEVR
jgi:hypothetical protein